MAAANVPSDTISKTTPRVGRGTRGSAVQVKFTTASKLQLGKARIRELRRSYREGRMVLLDIQKKAEINFDPAA